MELAQGTLPRPTPEVVFGNAPVRYLTLPSVAAVTPWPHFPFVRTSPRKLGFTSGMQVPCPTFWVELQVPTIGSGRPELSWKIIEVCHPLRSERTMK